jgi:hypothetical protein
VQKQPLSERIWVTDDDGPDIIPYFAVIMDPVTKNI